MGRVRRCLGLGRRSGRNSCGTSAPGMAITPRGRRGTLPDKAFTRPSKTSSAAPIPAARSCVGMVGGGSAAPSCAVSAPRRTHSSAWGAAPRRARCASTRTRPTSGNSSVGGRSTFPRCRAPQSDGRSSRGRPTRYGRRGCERTSRGPIQSRPAPRSRVLQDLMGRLRARWRCGTIAHARDRVWEQGNAELRGQVDSLARRVSALEGIRWGRREMVYATLMDMYRELHNISGGAAAATTFRDVLQAIAAD